MKPSPIEPNSESSSKPHGIAGLLASMFLNSKLTPLFIGASLVVGLFAVLAIPREEDPQIQVPMLDVMTAMPGSSPAEVEQRVTNPDREPDARNSWSRIRLLDFESGTEPGDCALQGWHAGTGCAGQGVQQARFECRPDTGGRFVIAGEGAFDRRCADSGADVVGRRITTAINCGKSQKRYSTRFGRCRTFRKRS